MTLYDKILVKIKNAEFLKQERGTIFVLTALLLPLMFGFLGFAYDVGNLYMHKARLQNTADAAVLAGARAYINKLGENAVNDIATNATDNQKAAAKSQLKSEAERYIRGNNPLFVGKAGRKEEFAFGTRTVSNDTTNKKVNTSEYFRVILREPVGLFFLPVIGVRNKVEVSVYATTKLSDTETTEGDGNIQPVEAENKPVVITGGRLHDEINTNDIIHNTYNNYDISTVYVTEGSDVTGAMIIDGTYVVPSSEGEIEGKVWQDNDHYKTVRYAKIVPTDYDMYAFGVQIKQRFLEKYIATLPQEERADARKRLSSFISALNTWNSNESLKKQWETLEKRIQQEHDRKYNEEYYRLFKESTTEGFEKAKSIYQLIQQYRSRLDSILSNYDWNRQNAYNAELKESFDNAIKALTNKNDDFGDTVYGWNPPPEPILDIWSTGPNGQPGQWEQYRRFGFESPTSLSISQISAHMAEYETQVLTPYMNEYRTKVTPTKTATNLGAEPKPEDYNLEYYMTFKGDRNKVENLSTSDISNHPANYGLNANEHSYLFLSKSYYTAHAAEDLNITVDGFYIGGSITTDTPYYILVDSDLKVTNLEIKNCNRPLVLYYLGTNSVHYNFGENKDVKGIFYSPHSKGDTHVNGTNINFSGSIISDEMTLKSHNSSFKYDPDDIKKWQKGDDGLPATPNVGFASSGGSSGGGTGESSEKITLLDRLRLYLAGGSNENNYYNNSDIIWSDI